MTGSPVATNLSPIAAQNTGSEPTLTNEDKSKYGGMFVACGPIGGLLEGEKAREVFLKSKLPAEKLGQIWFLADTEHRGSLDITDFSIAMYYIRHTMDGSIKNLPAVLPPSVLKACTGSSSLAKQSTGNLFGGSSSPDIPWNVTLEEKAKFDRFFDRLDEGGTGLVGGEEAGKFFLNSRLPESVLAQIWDISDITGSGLDPISTQSPSTSTGVSQTDKDRIIIEVLSNPAEKNNDLTSMRNQIIGLGKTTGDSQDKRSVSEMDYRTIMDVSVRLEQIKARHESEAKSIKELENTLASLQLQSSKLHGPPTIPEGSNFIVAGRGDANINNWTRSPQSNGDTDILDLWSLQNGSSTPIRQSRSNGGTLESAWLDFPTNTSTASISAAAVKTSATVAAYPPPLTLRAPQDRNPTVPAISFMTPFPSSAPQAPRAPQEPGKSSGTPNIL
ncbi:hypothetical protein BGX26_003457 [Mortierella sp. AD094]|nr:hypothetical protein BGX26_003457 [Mortierella sp. AD094]